MNKKEEDRKYISSTPIDPKYLPKSALSSTESPIKNVLSSIMTDRQQLSYRQGSSYLTSKTGSADYSIKVSEAKMPLSRPIEKASLSGMPSEISKAQPTSAFTVEQAESRSITYETDPSKPLKAQPPKQSSYLTRAAARIPATSTPSISSNPATQIQRGSAQNVQLGANPDIVVSSAYGSAYSSVYNSGYGSRSGNAGGNIIGSIAGSISSSVSGIGLVTGSGSGLAPGSGSGLAPGIGSGSGSGSGSTLINLVSGSGGGSGSRIASGSGNNNGVGSGVGSGVNNFSNKIGSSLEYRQTGGAGQVATRTIQTNGTSITVTKEGAGLRDGTALREGAAPRQGAGIYTPSQVTALASGSASHKHTISYTTTQPQIDLPRQSGFLLTNRQESSQQAPPSQPAPSGYSTQYNDQKRMTMPEQRQSLPGESNLAAAFKFPVKYNTNTATKVSFNYRGPNQRERERNDVIEKNMREKYQKGSTKQNQRLVEENPHLYHQIQEKKKDFYSANKDIKIECFASPDHRFDRPSLPQRKSLPRQRLSYQPPTPTPAPTPPPLLRPPTPQVESEYDNSQLSTPAPHDPREAEMGRWRKKELVRCSGCGGLLMNSYGNCDICARKNAGYRGRLPARNGQEGGLQRIRSEHEFTGYSPFRQPRQSRSPDRGKPAYYRQRKE